MIQSLQQVTDHTKINIDEKEYQRIREAMKLYNGTFPDEVYKNYKGKEKSRKFYDLNMTEVVAKYMASLVFNESCEITVNTVVTTDKDGNELKEKPRDVANEYVQGVLASNQFKKNLAKYLEPMFGTGGLAVRPYVDAKTKEVKFTWALANTFFPLKTNTNNVSECAIVTTSTSAVGKKKYYYTLFEFHEWLENGYYQISNELFESEEQTEVGVKVPLNKLYPELREVTEFEKLTRPLFSYVKPYGFNNINTHSPLGLGVADNAKGVLDQINQTNNQMEWDMRKSKPRIGASQHFAASAPAENGLGFDLIFDEDSEEFIFSQSDGDAFIKDLTFKFDPQPYVDKINYHFRMLEKKSQLSLGTFSYDGNGGIRTATEVVSEDSETFRNRNSQIAEVEQFLKELVITICELGKWAGIYTGVVPTPDQIGVDFDDGIFTDKNTQLEYYGKAKTLDLIPPVEAMIRVFNIPRDEAEKWHALIQQGKVGPSNATEIDKLINDKYPPEY